ncbi:MAG TPA: SIS domain-containing protein, partial [Burkholderiales bacterium]|nr:SIS domain-containing protein [Burkholderiales bacterium]
MKFAVDYIEELKKALAGLDIAAVGQAVSLLKEARDLGRSVFVLGNGGSAAIAAHLVVDLLKGASHGRAKKFKIMSLADNVPTLTAYLNDVGPDDVFVEPLKNFARKDDAVIAISGSGDSRNILAAVEYAAGIGCRTVAMTRTGGGRLR